MCLLSLLWLGYVIAWLSLYIVQKLALKKMNFFIFLCLAISIVLGIPDSDGIVIPLIGGASEFPAIDSVRFFSSL